MIGNAIMMRPRSDLGRLQYPNVDFTWSDDGQLLISRQPKESQWKTAKIGVASQVDDIDCPVRTLKNFMDRTANIRENLYKEHTLFLTDVEKEDQIRSIRPATIASWIQQVMQGTGIDTSIHKAHSLRAAASTWAAMHGHNIDQVKKHANWSNKSSTFEKYYFKPFNNFQESQSINNTIFSAMENNTTSSEPETEATRIGTSMPSNPNNRFLL
ncbi:hypothetical protein G6F62_000266 [Rhizopus arrhizus]|nr:hypothetical protein G6F62_000266 [Rhizopus arrhizus]